jgi:hypothetical protein
LNGFIRREYSIICVRIQLFWTSYNLILHHFSVVSKKCIQPVVISQRHRVTEEEKNHALERANELKSRIPYTVQVMMESSVYVGSFMVM